MSRALQVAFWLAVALLALGSLGPYRVKVEEYFASDPVVVRIDEHTITQSKLADALREQLWRRGETWDAIAPEAQEQLRETTLEHLIDSSLLHSIPSSLSVKADDEALWFQRQLDFQEGRYSAALQGQQLTEVQLRDQMRSQLQVQATLEGQLDVRIADDEARQWFDAHRDKLQAAECWRAAHLFLSNHDPDKPDRHDEIEALARQLSAGTQTFEDLIAKHSEDDRTKLRAGDLGWFTSERTPPDFIAAVRALPINKPSEPVQTKLGWHLIKVLDHKAARALTFDEAKAEIIAHLQTQRRATGIAAQLKTLRQSARITRNDSVTRSTVPSP